ncbi:PREDICTED: uncharacterized protein LOC109581390 isoform X2 [Amphimedon queenslandica]|uniref:CW-type domain-containing protein n=1 Tax=Amphimedon queenslandica TaxID=400682 RepID=A0AAN0J1Z7_AMPQE|nr:PREDICTED: uncharacterized protein LOC109581390 isoform X2 [Amphimedon queenslandica]|eukprot:XP_019851025.1 PREDICTED: uncharacterized protein LOC109581390 isoform X2 [Amphimedon queenslandica]
MANQAVLTRSGRKRAGLAPPSPLFCSKKKEAKIALQTDSGGDEEKSCKDNQQHQEIFIWVQCDNCQKWRKIDKNATVGEMWYCSMNPDVSFQSCDQPEEGCSSPKTGWLYDGFVPGELVWAKLSAYPPWPSIITRDPWCSNTYVSEEDVGLLYHVEFLGRTRSHCWLPQEMVVPYEENCIIGGSKTCPRHNFRHDKRIQYAISEADTMTSLSNEERLGTCQYTIAQKEKLDKSNCKARKQTEKLNTKSQLSQKGKNKGHPPSQQSSSSGLAPLSQVLDLLKVQPLLSSFLLQSIATDPSKIKKQLKIDTAPQVLKSDAKGTNAKTSNASTQLITKDAAMVNARVKCNASKQPLQPSSAVALTSSRNVVSTKTRITRPRKKKKEVSTSTSILQYFEPQTQSKCLTQTPEYAKKYEDDNNVALGLQNVPSLNKNATAPVCNKELVPPFFSPPLFSSPETNQIPVIDSAGDQTVPECICLQDLQEDAERNLLAIEQMMSQFDGSNNLSNSEDIVDYEKLAMEEMIQIEGYIFLSFFFITNSFFINRINVPISKSINT